MMNSQANPGPRHSRERRLRSLVIAAAVGITTVIAIQSGPAAVAASPDVVFDDMEHGVPFDNGWFTFDGATGAGGIDPNFVDLPPSDGGTASLQAGWGGGPGFYGGFGRTNPLDLSGAEAFNFWINPDAGQNYTLEINLQDDDNGDGAINPPDDDEFQFNCTVSATGPCAVAGGGWQLVSIPLADFFDDGSFLFGGNGELDPVSTVNGGNGELINVVVAVIDDGTAVNFRTDYWTFSGPPIDSTVLVDDFESGLPSGVEGDGLGIGFVTFSDGSPIGIATTDVPPAPLPESAADNNVLSVTGTVGSFAGVVHAFENPAVDTWVPQDWSSSVGMSFWLYGQNSGTGLFIDVIDNRNPGSTTDDGERFSVAFADDFSGWQRFEFPFADFVRKEIGNGAPNDGFTLTQVHGWAFGMLGTDGVSQTYYLDDVSLYGIADIPELAVTFAEANTDIDEGMTGNVKVKLNRPMNSDDPAQVSVDYATEVGSATPGRDYAPTSGTLTFVNGGPSELGFPLETFDDSKWEGTESVILRLVNPIDVEAGFAMQAGASILDDDPYDPLLLDDFERDPYFWESDDGVSLSNTELADSDVLARPGQDPVEGVLQIDAPTVVDIKVDGNVCRDTSPPPGGRNLFSWLKWLRDNFGPISVTILTSDGFDATTVDHATVRFGGASEHHRNWRTGEPHRHEVDVDRDGDKDLLFHFRRRDIEHSCGDGGLPPLTGMTFDGDSIVANGDPVGFSRDFPIGQDWSSGEALSFWYYGTGTGEHVTVNLKDNRAPDPGPDGWNMVWSEEFNEPAGTPPNPEYWSYEVGDGTVNGIPGWGNDEFQYYTDDPANVSTDGNGNMVLTVREADGSLQCYYGTCDYTSARLISKHKAEFAYGRIESRILVPDGESGLWPAFWSLGTDIDVVSWPQTGEIDFMEYVSRIPDEMFGTIHGPGYSGGQSYGSGPVYIDDDVYHTYAVEWYPDLIEFYLDGELYHTAEPADVPGEWVFNDPVYLLLNVAIGGNFGGTISPNSNSRRRWRSITSASTRARTPPNASRPRSSTTSTAGSRCRCRSGASCAATDQPAGAPDDGLDPERGVGLRLDPARRWPARWCDLGRPGGRSADPTPHGDHGQ